MSCPKKLGFGIFGYGSWAKYYLQAIASEPDVQLLGICGPDFQRAQKLVGAGGDIKVFTHPSELLSLDGLDAVCVVTPDYTHHDLVLAAAEAGKYVICEKPLGLTLAEAQEMERVLVSRGLVGLTGFTLRASTLRQRVHQLLQEGLLGRLYGFSFELTRADLLSPSTQLGWRSDPHAAPLGVLSDLGTHLFDQVLWMVGSVLAVIASLPVAKIAAYRPIDMEAVVLLECQGNVQGVMRVSRLDSRALHSPQETWAQMSFWGDKGALDLNGWWPTHGTFYPVGGQPYDIGTPTASVPNRVDPDPRVEMIRFFVRRLLDAVLYGKEASPNLGDGRAAQAVLEAAGRALGSKSWVHLPMIC